jgi:hypothetical protein
MARWIRTVLYRFAESKILWKKLRDEFVEPLDGVGVPGMEQLSKLVFFHKLFMQDFDMFVHCCVFCFSTKSQTTLLRFLTRFSFYFTPTSRVLVIVEVVLQNSS